VPFTTVVFKGINYARFTGTSGDYAVSFGSNATTIWPSNAVPAIPDTGPDRAVVVGVKFTSDVAGYVTGIRFYKGIGNTGTHTGSLWTAGGTLLASGTFANETASGWQQLNFQNPVAITPGTVYVASYHAPLAHYSYNEYYFAGTGVDSPPLHALRDGVSGFNGVFSYGPASNFPNEGWRSANYWVDVVFSPAGR
jgi:hypothetical protein